MNEAETEKLIKRLQELPELEPPRDLVSGVMKKIRPVRKSFWQQLPGRLVRPRHLTFTLKPLPLAGAAVFAAAFFYLGLVTGMHRVQPVTAPDQGDTVAEVLQDPQASFLAGRGLMAAGLVKEALPLLQRASLSSPDNPQYAYWEGLCFWANGMPAKERKSYMRGVDSSPQAVPLLLNLGHNLMEKKEFNSALDQYEKVLDISPDEQTALYNRGLIYHLQQDSKNERDAWKTYLQYYRSGQKSFRAVERLNSLGDFTYRTYQLGHRKVILCQSALVKMLPTNQMFYEVDILADGLRNDPRLQLDIVFFHENDIKQAREKALLLKKYIVAAAGEKEKKRVRLSWFGEKETVQKSGRNYQFPESLLLFGRRNFTQDKETSI